MPTLIISDLSPGELFARATENARRATAEIERLLYSVFEPGETREDRALKVAAHARVLAEAWTIIDSIASGEMPIAVADIEPVCTCGNCKTQPTQDNPNTN